MRHIDFLKVFPDGGLAFKCASGEIQLPFSYIEQDPESYGFPPAMIPVWREDINFVGFWHHWFTEGRESPLVEMAPEYEYGVIERARTFRQLLLICFFSRICNLEEIDEESIDAAVKLKVGHLDELLTIYREKGPDLCNLKALPEFQTKCPLVCEPTTYDGNILQQSNIAPKHLRNYCALEFDEETRMDILPDNAPPWFDCKDQKRLFDDLLGNGDWQGAWMTLNSNGWQFSDAKKAIIKLADKVGNAAFTSFANTWCNLPHEKYVAY